MHGIISNCSTNCCGLLVPYEISSSSPALTGDAAVVAGLVESLAAELPRHWEGKVHWQRRRRLGDRDGHRGGHRVRDRGDGSDAGAWPERRVDQRPALAGSAAVAGLRTPPPDTPPPLVRPLLSVVLQCSPLLAITCFCSLSLAFAIACSNASTREV